MYGTIIIVYYNYRCVCDIVIASLAYLLISSYTVYN